MSNPNNDPFASSFADVKLPAPNVVMEVYRSAEAYFSDRDAFVEYVRAVVNPAREKEELSVCTPAVASHLFDVIVSGRYRPDQQQWRWQCLRCSAYVADGRCQCTTSPSPWELKAV